MRDISLKLGWVIVAGVIAASSFPLIALPAATTTQSGTQPGVAASSATQASAAADGDTTVALKPVPSELQGKLDAKSAKVGDSVVVKTKAPVKIADGMEIPKGTKLIGHITDVQARAGNGESRIALEFDHAEIKGGQSLGIRSVIESLQPPVDIAGGGGGVPVQGGGGSTGGRGGGGQIGGISRGTAGGGASTTTGEPVAALGSTATDAAHATGAATDATSQAGSSVHQVPGYADGVTARATGVDGVSLASEATGATLQSASGILFSAKKNVHLNDGTQIVLAVTSGGGK